MEKREISVLFKQYYGKMYGMAVSILYDEQESKDVVSDIFERLLASHVVLLPDTQEHYLLTSVRNSCIKHLAQRKNRQNIAMLYASEQQLSASPEEDQRQLEKMLHIAQTHLSEQQRRIFQMRFLAGMKYEEIGEELGISRVAVWKHLSRIITIIKEQFKNSEL